MISGKLEIVRGSLALDISDIEHYVVEEAEGLGMPPLHRIREKGPKQHGETDLGYRLDKRVIQCVVAARAASWEEHFERRQELLEYLSPAGDDPVILRFTQPDGVTIRQIEGYVDGSGPVFAKKDARLYQIQRAAFRIDCPDPIWYDPDRKGVRAVGGGGGTGFSFPMAVPWTLGGIDIATQIAVDYQGSFEEYPEIVISGPIDNARIENLETGEVLELGGPTIENGDFYTIDLRYEHKTVVDSSGVNKVAELTLASDLATWHLEPVGSNMIDFSGENGGSNTSIILRWYNRYLGI